MRYPNLGDAHLVFNHTVITMEVGYLYTEIHLKPPSNFKQICCQNKDMLGKYISKRVIYSFKLSVIKIIVNLLLHVL